MSIRLLAITDPGCPASTRYRVNQFADYLQSRGVELQTFPWPADWSRNPAVRTELLGAAAQAGAVLFQRYLPDSAALRSIRGAATRLIYDFDDAVIYSESTRGKSRPRLRRGWRFRRMVRCCDAVTAGNQYLAGLAQRYAQVGRVHVLPTVVEPKSYEAKSGLVPGGSSPNGNPARDPHIESDARRAILFSEGPAALPVSAPAPSSAMEPVIDPTINSAIGPVIGWIGSRSTLPYLERLRSPLERLSREVPGLTVRVIADRRPDLGKTPVECVNWSRQTEVEELRRLRAGLAPLPDDSWTRGKCGLRLLQYLAAGVPAVASPVGTQSQVTDFGAALPARSDDDWVEALRRILDDRSFAEALAVRGEKLFRERFTVPAVAESVYSVWCGAK